jgi:hydrogenase maturation protease
VLLAIGIGSRSAGDDSVGLYIIDLLRQCPDLGCDLRAYEGGCPPGFLAEIPADTIIVFIDAVQTKADPGTICCIKLPSKFIACRHLDVATRTGVTLDQEIETARTRDGARRRMFLLGIQVLDTSPGSEMTPKVRAAADDVVRNFQRYLKLASDMT